MQTATSVKPHSQPANRPPYWVLFFTLLGFGLRLYRLDFQPLWGDEGWSFYFATQPLGELLALTAVDIHPPLYYLLLKAWLTIAGVEAEIARLLSIAIGTLLLPTLYVLGHRLFERRVGLLAAGVGALMPLAIYYSQEVRMYGLVTLLGALSMYAFIRWQQAPNARSEAVPPQNAQSGSVTRDGEATTAVSDRLRAFNEQGWLIAYILTTTAALYTHYYAALLLICQGLLLLFTLAERRAFSLKSAKSAKSAKSIKPILAAITPLAAIGLLYLPWLVYVIPRLSSYVENKRAVEGYLPLHIVRFFGDHFVAFSIGHLPAELRLYVWVALPFIFAASLGFVAALYFNRNRPYAPLFLYLFVPLLLGYLINEIFPFNPPYFERTLLLAAPAYWLFIAAGLLWLWERQYLLVGTVVLAMLLATGLVLASFYTVPRYPHEDYRPMLKKIAAQATPQDTLLASYQWQWGFYQAYLPSPRPQIFEVPGWGAGWAGSAGQPRLVADLTAIFAESPRLWFPAYQASGHLWEDQAETALDQLGYPALLEWYGPQTKLTLTRSPATTLVDGPTADFSGQMRLIASQVGNSQYEAGRGIVPVDLLWQKAKNLGSEHRVSLRLADGAGRTWATRDSHPQGNQAFFTDLAIGEQLVDRHGLLIPAGTPPGNYRLLLSVRRDGDAHPLDLVDEAGQPLGAELPLAEVTVIDPEPPVGPAALPVQTARAATFGQAVNLIGYSLGQEPFKAGQSMPLTLFWQSRLDSPPPLTVTIELQDAAGQTVVAHQRAPVRPSQSWRQGTLLLDPQEVYLPPTLPPGAYQVTLALVTPEQKWLPVAGEERLPLTTVTTVDRPHVFEPPDPQIDLGVSFGDQARLVGVDLPETRVKSGDGLPVTLYWQGLQTFDRSWTVFVHLVDEQGQIISQQDQVPGSGQFPTTGWLPNEYLTDTYRLLIPAEAAPGAESYQLRIGLYDANDFSRLPVVEDGQVVNDHIILENWQISVE